MTTLLSNARDTGRVIPTVDLAPNVMKEADGVVLERIVGPAASATVKLSRPGVKVRHIQSFVTATGVFSAKPNLTEGVDYTVNLNDPNNGGVATLTEALGTDYSAATWVVWYSPLAAEGTIGGKNSVTH